MGTKTKPSQIVMYCPCGQARVLAKGLCSTCYTLRRQDEAHFGGHREAVLRRDGFRCRVPGCTTLKRGKRSVAVHHRQPGSTDPATMITLCLPCHAKVTRTFHVQDDWPDLLRILWREQHPEGHEQSALNFGLSLLPPAIEVPLFKDLGRRAAPKRIARKSLQANS
jgi:hypothetical protein